MIRGLYTAYSGLQTQLTRQAIITNNLANALTPGYRQDRPVMEGFRELLLAKFRVAGAAELQSELSLGEFNPGVHLADDTLDLAGGRLYETGQDGDLAIVGDGYFVIETPNGNAYTRDGRFQVDAEGRLVTGEGYPVLGQNGPIAVGDAGHRVRIDGSVEIGPGQIADQIQIVVFPAGTNLTKQGTNLLAAGGAAPEAIAGQVRQGLLEGSNVNLEDNQMALMATLRAYQVARETLRANDETLAKAVNDVGRLA